MANEILHHEDPTTTVYIHGLKYAVNEESNQACFFVEDIEENSTTINGKKFLWQSQKWIVMIYDESKLSKRRKTRRKTKRTFKRHTKTENEAFEYEVAETISLDLNEDHNGTTHLREYIWKPKVVNTEESYILVTYSECSQQTTVEDIVKHKHSSSYVGNVTHDDFEMTYDFTDDVDHENYIEEPPLAALAKLTYISEKLIHVANDNHSEDDNEEESYTIVPISIKLSYEPTVLWVEPYDGRYGLSTSHFELSERYGNSCETSLLKVTTGGGYLSDFSLSFSDARRVKKYRNRKDIHPRYDELPNDVIVIDKIKEEAHESSDDEGFEDIEFDFEKGITVQTASQSTNHHQASSPQSNYGSYSPSALHKQCEEILEMFPIEKSVTIPFNKDSESAATGSDSNLEIEEDVNISICDDEDGRRNRKQDHNTSNELQDLQISCSPSADLPRVSNEVHEEFVLPKPICDVVNRTEKPDKNNNNSKPVLPLTALPITSSISECLPDDSEISMHTNIVSRKNNAIEVEENDVTETNFRNPDVSQKIDHNVFSPENDVKREVKPDELPDLQNLCYDIKSQRPKTETNHFEDEHILPKTLDRVPQKVRTSENSNQTQLRIQVTPIIQKTPVKNEITFNKSDASNTRKIVVVEEYEEVEYQSEVFITETDINEIFESIESDNKTTSQDFLKLKGTALPEELSEFQDFQCKGIIAKNGFNTKNNLNEEYVLPKPDRSVRKVSQDSNVDIVSDNIVTSQLLQAKPINHVMLSESTTNKNLSNTNSDNTKTEIKVTEEQYIQVDQKDDVFQQDINFDNMFVNVEPDKEKTHFCMTSDKAQPSSTEQKSSTVKTDQSDETYLKTVTGTENILTFNNHDIEASQAIELPKLKSALKHSQKNKIVKKDILSNSNSNGNHVTAQLNVNPHRPDQEEVLPNTANGNTAVAPDASNVEVVSTEIQAPAKIKKSLSYRAKKMIKKTLKSGKGDGKTSEETNKDNEQTDVEKLKKKSRFSFRRSRSTDQTIKIPKSHSETTGVVFKEEKPKSQHKYRRSDTMPVAIISINDRITQYRRNSKDILDEDDDTPKQPRRRLVRSQSFESTLDSGDKYLDYELRERRKRLAGYSYTSHGINQSRDIVKSREYTIQACEKEMHREITLVKKERTRNKSNSKSMETSLDVLTKLKNVGHVEVPEVFLGSTDSKLTCSSPKLKVGRINIPKAFSIEGNLDEIGTRVSLKQTTEFLI